MFWFLRESFDAVGGFDALLVSAQGMEIARRRKAYSEARGKRCGTNRRHGLTTSCRNFDMFGDWYLFRNPRLAKKAFESTNRPAADRFYYDVDR
jgi:hypothetical protein